MTYDEKGLTVCFVQGLKDVVFHYIGTHQNAQIIGLTSAFTCFYTEQ